MIKKLFLALCFLPSALCLPAIAQSTNQQWIPVSKGAQGEIFSIDKNSIQPNGSAYGFWIHVDHAQGAVSATRMYMAANCGNDMIQSYWIIESGRNGQITKNEQLNTLPVQAAYGTVSSQLVNAVCTGFSSDPQLAALTRARQSNAEAIGRAMESVANMYK
jgi:hypothetical protein